jgi:hypothetical protein
MRPLKNPQNLPVPVTNVFEEVLTWRRRLVCGPKFDKGWEYKGGENSIDALGCWF